MSLWDPRNVPPYPPPIHQRRTGGQCLAQAGHDPPDLDSSGPLKFHYLANQQATDGDYGLYRVDIAPNGGGAIPHFHRTISEAFFVLSGTLKLYDGSDWIDGHRTTSSTFHPAASTASAMRPTRRRRS